MDQTELFKATVRTLKLRRKKQGAAALSPGPSSSPSHQRTPSEFATLARDVTCVQVAFISKLQAFLLKHRKNYIDSARHLLGGGSAMSDSERDAIDSEAQKFIEGSLDRINSLRTRLNDNVTGAQMSQYRQSVFESLQDYLKKVANLYSEQRAIRIKRIVDRKRTSRLQPEKYRRLLGSTGCGRTSRSSFETSSGLRTIDREPSPAQHQLPDNDDCDSSDPGEGGREERGVRGEDGSSGTTLRNRWRRRGTGGGGRETSGNLATSSQFSQDSHLTEKERTEFAEENEQLLEHVTTMVDEVRQIEGRVIEISKLQGLFSQKVLQQAEQLESISRTTVEAAENVSEGNEQIKGAIKNKASLRVWILFILILLSFAILFLDWYS
ncbi:Syntaxin-18 [Geodia barretti]|uniref:Syntaxin-18 n=1 Tax=Geodia barretti TaxID=519541 RepID=A0AA35U259_GEOBA|nr:Syntaxin-18 [Geodia barretti]